MKSVFIAARYGIQDMRKTVRRYESPTKCE